MKGMKAMHDKMPSNMKPKGPMDPKKMSAKKFGGLTFKGRKK